MSLSLKLRFKQRFKLPWISSSATICSMMTTQPTGPQTTCGDTLESKSNS